MTSRLSFFVSGVLMLFFAARAHSASINRINSVTVASSKGADVVFSMDNAETFPPSMKIVDNIVELTFSGVELAEALNGKIELVAPHALINRISVYSPENNVVRARIAVNGSTDGLKNRATLVKGKSGFSLSLQYPLGENATLSLLKEEQEPLSAVSADSKTKAPLISVTQIFLITLMFVLAAVSCYFFVRFLQKKSGVKGPRKYLIEQISYCTLGPKTGVSLLKVGSEFVLVGVTPQSVSMLSTLPRLQNQYEEESSFDRTNFKHAVQEEFERIKTPSVI